MKKITLCLLTFCGAIIANISNAQYPGPAPAHVVVVMEENYAYAKIIGSSLAPTLTALSKDTFCANMTLATAITHPSEPNYLELFSDSNQGVTTDLSGPCPGAPLNNCNLGSSIIQAGHTFIGYSEDQPSPGWYLGDAGNYYTKHCPWINWIGHNTNPDTIPLASDLPMFPLGTYYPDSMHYSNLPTMAWVIPNSIDDMHDGSASSAIPNGDNWFKTNMMPLVRWAANPANNTVIIVIWDEDDYTSSSPSNHIPLLICGGLVKGGNCNAPVNHYSVSRMMEEMFNLPFCAKSKTATEVPSSIWRATVGINSISGTTNEITTWPVPAKDVVNVTVSSVSMDKATLNIYDMTGKLVKQLPVNLNPGDNNISINTWDMVNGIYFFNLVGNKINVSKKIIVSK